MAGSSPAMTSKSQIPMGDRSNHALHRRSRRAPSHPAKIHRCGNQPVVDEWEKAEQFPSHELFKKLGDLGFLGLNKPVEFGGQGLDYSFALMMAEELGAIRCGGVRWRSGCRPIWRRRRWRGSAPMKCAANS